MGIYTDILSSHTNLQKRIQHSKEFLSEVMAL